MSGKKLERVGEFIHEAVAFINDEKKADAMECLNHAQALINPNSENIVEINELGRILFLKSMCASNPEESASLIKESIRVDESRASGRNYLESNSTYASLSQKYMLIGKPSKAIENADKVDIDCFSDERGMPDILMVLYETNSAIRGKDDNRSRMFLAKCALIAERIDDVQNYVKACTEFAKIALNYDKDKASAFHFCEKAWVWETRGGFENVQNFRALFNISKAAWDCIPNKKGILWTRRIKAVTAKIISFGYMDPDIAKMYLASAYTLELQKPKESADKDCVAKCMATFENDKRGLAACMAEAALHSKTYS